MRLMVLLLANNRDQAKSELLVSYAIIITRLLIIFFFKYSSNNSAYNSDYCMRYKIIFRYIFYRSINKNNISNSACAVIFGQEKEPDSLAKYKKY